MKIDFWKIINYTTFLLCLSGTIGLSVYSVIRYCANEDTTLVQVSKYHSSKERMYPSHSICILPPFLEDKFKSLGDDRINMSLYIAFLEGKIWDDRLLDIDYDNVTVSFATNLLKSKYLTQNRKWYDWNPIFYTSLRSSTRKCFTIDAPFIDNELLMQYQNGISNDIFPDGGRAENNSIYVYLHYPGQRSKVYFTVKGNWDSRDNKSKIIRCDFLSKT